MQIIAENIGKKYSKEWIFRNFSFSIQSNQSFAFTGANGSGKSTLLQVLAGALPSTEGRVYYKKSNHSLPEEDFYKYISYAAPYLELIEELSIRELVDFHSKCKPLVNGMTTEAFIQRISLNHASEKEIRMLSSGMKQRVKLGLALFTDTPILLLDEPTTNFDATATEWYLEEINKQLGKRMILICSNQRYEHDFCDEEIRVKK